MSRRFSVFVTALLAVASLTDVALAEPQFSGINRLDGQPDVVLVSPSLEPAPVFFEWNGPPGRSSSFEQDFRAYLGTMSGRGAFRKLPASGEIPERAILIGTAGGFEIPDGLSPEGFLIRTEGQRLRICGGTLHATAMGLYALLEQLGCRWWSRDEEVIPQLSTIRVKAQDTHIEPAFQRHNCFNREAQWSTFGLKRRTISRLRFTGGHNLCPMLKPFAEKNPVFLPMDKNGERKFNNIHMNYAAPGIADVLTDLLRAEVKKRQQGLDSQIFFAGMGDWYGGMDMSPESQRIYEQEAWTDADGRKKPGYIAPLLRMINHAAEALEAEHPGIQIGTFAYMSLEAPPASTRPRDNVVIRIPRLRHDTVRSILESPKNASFRRNLDRWCELAPGRVHVWEYGTNFNNFLMPFPCLRSLAENIRYYHKAGVAGVQIQGNYVSTGGDLAVLKNYVWSRLLWDPTRDVDDLLHEFCGGYYGPAAEELIAYVNLLEDSVRGDEPIQADEFDKRFAWMTPELVARARALFDRAFKKTGDADPYFRRVKEAEASLEAWHLWKPGPLEEAGERLVRADLGGDTFERAQSLIKHCRGASPREWGNGPKYHMNFLKMHGGPMPILRQDDVTVKVAPIQNGQLRSVLLGDIVAIDESHVLSALDSVYYDLTARSGNRVEMSADLGVSMWSRRHQKQAGHRTVELTEDGVIRCSGSFERLGARYATNQVTFVTTYRVEKSPDDVRITFTDREGELQNAPVSTDSLECEIPVVSTLQITRLDRGVVIDDIYQPSDGEAAGKVVFDPKARTITVSVEMPAVEVAPQGRTEYGRREIRLRMLDVASHGAPATSGM